MPGILYHLSFAQQVYSKLSPILQLDKINFMAGNLIPDLAKADKQKTHYRKKASNGILCVPDLEQAKKELYIPNDSIKFGMYAHLYLDYYFFGKFLIDSFIWNKENEKVINPRNNKEWSFNYFFSENGLYKSYGEINYLMLKDKRVSMKTLQEIPEILPNTGIALFDERIKTTWKKELEEYLSRKIEYTGEILEYPSFWNFIEETAEQFAKDTFLIKNKKNR